MARAPFNVVVYLYRQSDDGTFEYALFKRSDLGFWQGVSGGGEDDETPCQAARREIREETGIAADAPLMKLDRVEPVPVTEFNVGDIWGDDIYVNPQYCFGALVEDRAIVLSDEHTEYRWLNFEQARNLVKGHPQGHFGQILVLNINSHRQNADITSLKFGQIVGADNILAVTFVEQVHQHVKMHINQAMFV